MQPGETRTVTIALDFRAFAYYHPAYKQWITESGEFDLLIGASAADIRCKETVTLESTLDLPSLLNRQSTVREWLEDPRGRPVFGPVFQMMTAAMGATFGGGDGHEAIGMDMTGFMMEMPLLSMLLFQEKVLPLPAEELVDGLLRQVHGLENGIALHSEP